jgi:hypothetical protein
VYSPDIPASSADFVQFTPWYWNSLYYGLISRGECSALQLLMPFTQYQFSFQQVPITAGWPEAMWIQALPKDCIHDRCAGNRTPDLSLLGPTLYHSAMHSTSHLYTPLDNLALVLTVCCVTNTSVKRN